MGRLDGKVALITGGARGMGEAHVRHFVGEGAKVVFGDILEAEGAKVAADVGEACRFLRMDVTREDDWEAATAAAVETFGKLDVLVNNAGILIFRKISAMTLDEFRQVIDVNMTGTWLGIKAAIAPMTAAGRGSIVNVSSIEGFIGAAGLSAYSASKFAIRGITKAAARELARLRIRVNSIHPGGVATRMVENPDLVAAVDAEAFAASMPIKRFAKPIEVSRVAAFLASDEASYCTGSEFVVDGGILTGAGY
jgi:3alpha(or 20beta)-hydroxysteroid dehydrogenase